jgi:ABC-2 type transport system permease protein
MIRLTKVELRRLFSRRLTVIALLGALAVISLMLFGSYQQAKPLSGTELAQQRVYFDQSVKDWDANGAQMMKDCLAQQPPPVQGAPQAATGADCSQMKPNWATWGKPQAKFATTMPSILTAGSYLLAGVGFLIGTGFLAAEFSSGSMANWLTFEPRRLRVYVSKLSAAGLGLIPVAVALLGLLTAGVWLIVGQLGTTAGTTTKIWGDLGEMGARSIALTVSAAVVGAAIGVLLRHTAAVIGIAMAYLVLVEAVFGQALQSAQPWLLRLNFQSWLSHGTKYFSEVCKTDAQGGYSCQGVEKVLTFGHSTTYLGIMVVLIIGLAAVVFRRRDVS